MKLKKIHVATKHLKSAWINDEDQVIAFREIDSARNYSATEGGFLELHYGAGYDGIPDWITAEIQRLQKQRLDSEILGWTP
jgi:hypothetical protein